MRRIAAAVCVILSVLSAGQSVSYAQDQALFASVAGEKIVRAEFETAVNVTARQRYYHGQMPEERIQALRHEVAGVMVDKILLRREAQKRSLKVNDASLAERVSAELSRYRVSELNDAQAKHLEEMLHAQLREELLIDALKSNLAAGVMVTPGDVERYYKANIDKFTTPVQQSVSVILLKVAPSSKPEVWQAAQAEAEKLKRRLDGGADFAEMASLHSGDASAENGGDLGFIHQGMLSAEAQVAVDKLAVGEVSEPVAMLQGVALFRLNGVKEAVVNPLGAVRERAEGLMVREQIDMRWRALLEELRASADIEIHDDKIKMANMWAGEAVMHGR